MIDAVNFMALDKIARDCMGDATGTGKNTEKTEVGDNMRNQQSGIPTQYVQYDTKNLQRLPTAPLAAPSAMSGLVISSVEAEPSVDANGVRIREDVPQIGMKQDYDADLDRSHARSLHQRQRMTTVGSEENDAAHNLAIKLWACCCCFLIILIIFILLEPITFTPVRGGFT